MEDQKILNLLNEANECIKMWEIKLPIIQKF